MNCGKDGRAALGPASGAVGALELPLFDSDLPVFLIEDMGRGLGWILWWRRCEGERKRVG